MSDLLKAACKEIDIASVTLTTRQFDAPFYMDIACFHTAQAAEKALKYYMSEKGGTVMKGKTSELLAGIKQDGIYSDLFDSIAPHAETLDLWALDEKDDKSPSAKYEDIKAVLDIIEKMVEGMKQL